ncbi:MAG: biosynthetic peptidoglycan transglycosylase [Gemmatimonadaceae bacterium]
MTGIRLIVRLTFLGLMVALADVALTPWSMRPELQSLVTRAPATTSFMRQAIAEGRPVRHRTWVPLSAVSPMAACAVVLAEDEEFFEKGTISWRAQHMLMQRMLRGDFSRGGSGISQQLARNLYLTADRTPRRKAREYVLAHELSQTLDKRRQLELYLNVAEWGRGIWGIEAAAQHYFRVPASALTASQSVILASLLPAPRRELQYAGGPLAARRQESLVRKLWAARLLSDPELLQTVDRIREWRHQVRQRQSASSADTNVAGLMGQEAPSFQLTPSNPGALPLARLCDPRRRGF